MTDLLFYKVPKRRNAYAYDRINIKGKQYRIARLEKDADLACLERFQACIDGKIRQLHFFGSGSYNVVYTFMDDNNDTWVLRLPKYLTTDEYPLKADDPVRTERLLNWLNDFPDGKRADAVAVFSTEAGHYEIKRQCERRQIPVDVQTGVLAPFIASDELDADEICQALVKQYKEKNRILVDACTKGNFRRAADGVQIYNVDPAAALLLTPHADMSVDELDTSHASDDFWETMHPEYHIYFEKNTRHHIRRKIAQTTQALLLLRLLAISIHDLEQYKIDLFSNNLIQNLAIIYVKYVNTELQGMLAILQALEEMSLFPIEFIMEKKSRTRPPMLEQYSVFASSTANSDAPLVTLLETGEEQHKDLPPQRPSHVVLMP